MNIFQKLFGNRQKTSASLAKERLQIIVSHERGKSKRDYLPLMQKELVSVIAKYIDIDEDQVNVSLEQQDSCSVLELNITLPNAMEEA